MSDYIPKPDAEGINSPSDESPVKDSLILLIGFMSIVFCLYFIVIYLSDFILTRISLKNEIHYVGKIWNSSKLSENKPDIILEIEKQIAKHIDFPIQIGILCDTAPNALAFPGGKILLTSGLLKELKTENGLVFVIGHEIGHFVNRDHIRGLGRQIIFGLGSSLMGFEGVTSLASVQHLFARSYDRKQEVSADQYGLEILNKIYGHTTGADELFLILAKNETQLEKSISRITSTHPPSQDRADQIKKANTSVSSTVPLPEFYYEQWAKKENCL